MDIHTCSIIALKLTDSSSNYLISITAAGNALANITRAQDNEIHQCACVQNADNYLFGKGGYVSGSVGLSVCLPVCKQYSSKCYERIGMKYYINDFRNTHVFKEKQNKTKHYYNHQNPSILIGQFNCTILLLAVCKNEYVTPLEKTQHG